MTADEPTPQWPDNEGTERSQWPDNDLDMATVVQVADLAHESLRHVLGTLGRPGRSDIAMALEEALLPYTDPDYYPLSRDRYSTIALLDGRLMLALDHQAWAWQVFVVTSPACLLPEQSRPMLDEPDQHPGPQPGQHPDPQHPGTAVDPSS